MPNDLGVPESSLMQESVVPSGLRIFLWLKYVYGLLPVYPGMSR